MAVFTSLVQENDLVNIGCFQFKEFTSDSFWRADQFATRTFLASRRLFPFLVSFPEVDRARLEGAFLVIEL